MKISHRDLTPRYSWLPTLLSLYQLGYLQSGAPPLFLGPYLRRPKGKCIERRGAPGAASALTVLALLSPFATYFPEAAAVQMEHSPDTSLEWLEDHACLFISSKLSC